MPFIFLFIGILLLVSGLRNTATVGNPNLVTLIKGDFTGTDNFIYWVIAIMVIGALGYIDELKGLSISLLVLVIIVLFLSNGGFFTKFQQAISTSTNS